MDTLSIAIDKIIWFRITNHKLYVQTHDRTFIIENMEIAQKVYKLLHDPQTHTTKKWLNIHNARL